MNGELLTLIDAIVRDRGIDRELLIEAIETALASAVKKGVGKDSADVTVTIDRKKGGLTVVCDGKEMPSTQFSRIGAQTAKQVIMQKIREAERDVIFTEFQGKVGDILAGTVHRFERGDIIVDLGRAEAIVPKPQRIPYEEYQQGDRIQGYVIDVRKGAKGAEIVLSRTDERFIRGLFALEVPEINEGIVEIKGLAREPGDRTKVAVSSKDEKVDCVGACVGMRGTRVKNIVRELHGEKIDIIRWHEGCNDFLAAALSPAKIADIRANPETRQAMVLVDDDQLSLAIGKKGQNVRLASKLTGWQLEISSRAQQVEAAKPLQGLPGVGPAMEERLKVAGITTIDQLINASVEQLSEVKGVGKKTAEKIINVAKDALRSASAKPHPTSEEPDTTTEPAATLTAEPKAEPDATPTAEPESDTTSTAEPEAEPDTTAEPEPEATLTAEPESDATAEPESDTKPEPEPEATPTAEPKAEPETMSEPTAEPEPDTTSTAEPEAEPDTTAEPEPEATLTAEPESDATAEPEPEPPTSDGPSQPEKEETDSN